LTENNYIYKIIKGEDVGRGELKKQREEYLEFLNFREADSNKSLSPHHNVIEFTNFEPEKSDGIKLPMKYAADSGASPADIAFKKSKFLTSNDGNFAIKYSKKLNEEIHLTVLSDCDEYSGEIILYSGIIGKYFVSNINGDFIIGQYSNFDLCKFNFKAFTPFESIIIHSDGDNITAIPLNKLATPEIIEITDINIKLKVNTGAEISNAVLKTTETKDFLKTDGIYIDIPRMLISDKAEIFLY